MVLHFFVLLILLTQVSSGIAYIDLEGGIDMKAKQIDYDLPYPGILPDNLLYPIKIVRDNFWLGFTRSAMKKAEILLLFSDKKTSMAMALSKKAKWDKGSEMMMESEKDFKKMVTTLTLAKNQGTTPEDAFVQKIRLSNEKHREVIEDLLSNTPQGSRKILEDAIVINNEIRETLTTAF